MKGMEMNIHGWTKIVPQLAAYFVVSEERRKAHAKSKRSHKPLSPLNIFLSGFPGTNKSEGIEEIADALELSYGSVDCSTIDDISELAGVVNLQANRERGEAEMIVGGLLSKDVCILDEFLNARPHVVPQFRNAVQGKLTLFGKPFPITNKNLVMAGNLSENMEHGDANQLDTPTADRFAMVIDIPSMVDMEQVDRLSILRADEGSSFGIAFEEAIATMRKNFNLAAARHTEQAIRFVDAMTMQLGRNGKDKVRTSFAIEGRRGKILVKLVLAGLALTLDESEEVRKETMWKLVRDSLSYHRLSGITLDFDLLKTEFEDCYDQNFAMNSIESIIVTEPTLSGKIGLLVRNLAAVSLLTKSDLIGQVVASDDIELLLACKQLIDAPIWANQPAELTEMLKRIDLNRFAKPVPISAARIALLASLNTDAERQALSFCGHDEQKMRQLLARVDTILENWAVK
jgi:MoxR-like ATPase